MSEQDKHLREHYEKVLISTGALFGQEITQEHKDELYNAAVFQSIRELDVALAKLKAFSPLATKLPVDVRISLSKISESTYDEIGSVIEEINRLFPIQ